MIWLSTIAGAELCSIYFEIRNIDVQRTGSHTEGVVSGLLGDGRCELWSEVFLGATPRVQILPQWSDDGQVEGFDAALDESALQQQLLTAVQKVFNQFTSLAGPDLSVPLDVESRRSQTVNGFLAA